MKPFWLPFGARKARNEEGPRYADILERAVAASIDLWVLYVLFFSFFQWMTVNLFARTDEALYQQSLHTSDNAEALRLFWASGTPQIWAINCMLQLTVIGVFLITMQLWWHTTPGKWLMGLKIVRRRTLETPHNWQYVVRYIGYIVAAAPLMIGILWANFNKEHRGWHDMLARTVVIHTRPRGWYWAQVKRGWKKLRSREI